MVIDDDMRAAVYAEFQQFLGEMIERHAGFDEAGMVEAFLTVALANKARLHGPEATAAVLAQCFAFYRSQLLPPSQKAH